MRQNPACVLHQMIEQPVFSRPQLNQFPIDPDLMFAKVDHQAIVNDNLSAFLILTEAASSQYCPNAAGQLAGTEGFGDVIIGAQFKPFDLVLFLSFGGQHDHRYIPNFPDHLQNCKSIDIRHHDIQQDQVRQRGTQFFHGLGAVVCLNDLKSVLLQI